MLFRSPLRRARRGARDGVVRLQECATRHGQFPHALADPTDLLYGERAAFGPADSPVRGRTARQWLEQRVLLD